MLTFFTQNFLDEKNAFARTRQKSPTSRLRRALGLGLNSTSITDITKRLKGSNDRLGSLLRKHSSKRHKNDGGFATDSAEITGRGEGCSAVFYDEMLDNSNGATAKQTTGQQQSKNGSQADYSAKKFSTHSTTDSDRTMVYASSSKNASSLASECYENAQLTATLKCQPKAQVKTSLPAVKMFSEKTV